MQKEQYNDADVGDVLFAPLADEPGIELIDSIGRRRITLDTGTVVHPTPVSLDRSRVPVDTAIQITTDTIRIPQLVDGYIRERTGDTVAELHPDTHTTLPTNEYTIELSAQLKIYLQVNCALTATVTTDQVEFAFEPATTVRIGARSYHDQPAGTITTTQAPTDMMQAVSALSSALKTTSCERSYPTLRGHPPTIELGDTLTIPSGLTPTDTGIRVELPEQYRAIYVAAPLAYYLGATLAPGDTPRIVTETGFEYSLTTAHGFETEIERVLKQVVFLDCLTRTEGHYQVDLYERDCIDPCVDLEFESLYDRPIAYQLEAYLTVPFDALHDHIPEWSLTAYIAPTPDRVEVLPFVVNELAVVRSPDARKLSASEVECTILDDYMETYFRRNAPVPGGTRSTSPPQETPSVVQPQLTDAQDHAWFSDHISVGTSKGLVDAYRNKLDRTPSEGPIDIAVVCNDAAMDAEYESVEEIYGTRDELAFNVTLYRDVSTVELQSLLTSELDFIHYIGHIDSDGFECSDGMFDAGTLDSVTVETFFLNACCSYDQGMALIEAGSIGGVTTFSDVINSGAVRIGRTMARLLNRGFPLRAALTIARETSVVGGYYLIVGDGNVDVVQANNGIPVLREITSTEDGYELSLRTYLPSGWGVGSTISPTTDETEHHFLIPGVTKPVQLSKTDLHRYLSGSQDPCKIDGQFVWDTSLDDPFS